MYIDLNETNIDFFLLNNLYILVPIRPCMLVIKAECVHNLMHGPPRTAEAITILPHRFLQGQLLPPALVPYVGPATSVVLPLLSRKLVTIYSKT